MFFPLGLFAAGLTIAVTAPLAAAYATCGVLGWKQDARSWRFRAVWMVVLVVGASLAAVGKKPIAAIVFAQAANGVLLPLVAVFLLVAVNRKDRMGAYANRLTTNLLGGLVVLVTLVLGVYWVTSAVQKVLGAG